jgi:D-alanyl-D-alanine carboxypeptidase (penicillin-binding protein 5/6)
MKEHTTVAPVMPAPEAAHEVQTERVGERKYNSPREALDSWQTTGRSFTLSRAHALCVCVLIVAVLFLAVATPLVLVGGREVFFTTSPWWSTSLSHSGGGVASQKGDRPFADGAAGNVLLSWSDNAAAIPTDTVIAKRAALADTKTGEIIASRKADERMYPASMTKVMTLIVVAENLPREDSLKTEITVSREVYEAMKKEGSSGIGMEVGEKMTVESMLHALMLRSDGIAATELAHYIAGSEEDFVELMNQKAYKMGLQNTHFENPTGLYHKDHYSSCRDIASIMAYAMEMSLCRRVLMTQSYVAPFTTAEGESKNYFLYHNLIVTQFDKTKPNQPTEVTVVAGKTGFTDESKYCLVTYAESADGHGFVAVTAESDSYASCIKDYLTIYNTYAKP